MAVCIVLYVLLFIICLGCLFLVWFCSVPGLILFPVLFLALVLVCSLVPVTGTVPGLVLVWFCPVACY